MTSSNVLAMNVRKNKKMRELKFRYMTRLSNDEYKDGRLYNGYDYQHQAWVKDGVYVDCGHSKGINCGCYGARHKGRKPSKGYYTGFNLPL